MSLSSSGRWALWIILETWLNLVASWLQYSDINCLRLRRVVLVSFVYGWLFQSTLSTSGRQTYGIIGKRKSTGSKWRHMGSCTQRHSTQCEIGTDWGGDTQGIIILHMLKTGAYSYGWFNAIWQSCRSALSIVTVAAMYHEWLRKCYASDFHVNTKLQLLELISCSSQFKGYRLKQPRRQVILWYQWNMNLTLPSSADKLQSTASFTNGIEDLRKMSDGDELMESTVEGLRAVDELTRAIQEGQ